MKRTFTTTGLLILACVGLAGCATTQALHTESSTAAIRSAEDLGANSDPEAALHLQLAKEELDAATALNEKGEKEQANSLLLRAEADAELAIALSQAETDKTAARAAMDRVHALQAENPYAPKGAK